VAPEGIFVYCPERRREGDLAQSPGYTTAFIRNKAEASAASHRKAIFSWMADLVVPAARVSRFDPPPGAESLPFPRRAASGGWFALDARGQGSAETQTARAAFDSDQYEAP
jgi:hypothetical protein